MWNKGKALNSIRNAILRVESTADIGSCMKSNKQFWVDRAEGGAEDYSALLNSVCTQSQDCAPRMDGF